MRLVGHSRRWLRMLDNQHMGMRAVGVDLGGVLERIGEPAEFLDRWRERLGMSEQDWAGILVWPLHALGML